MINRKFLNNSTGDVVEVMGLDDGIADLSDGNRILATRLTDANLYTEYIDPNTFFESRKYDELIDGVKNIQDLSRATNSDSYIEVRPVRDYEDDGVYRPEVNEEDMIQRAIDNQKRLQDSVGRQQELIEKQLNGEVMPKERKRDTLQQNENVYNNDVSHEPREPVQRIEVDNSMTQMFKSIKRSQDIKFDLVINEKVPRKDFMEMWEESYEQSIIEYFADEFVYKLTSNPIHLKQIIIDALTEYVYGKDKGKVQPEINTEESTPAPKRRSRKKPIEQ
jgi:hypothetical protein